jgi:penicillin-binding protein 1A
VDVPVVGAPDWRPKNFDREFTGPIILKSAFTRSINTVAAQLIWRAGPEKVVDVARRCGIESRLEPVYSLALGTSGVSPLEMASAFSTFANGGIRHEPFLIWRVEDSIGRVLEERLISGEKELHPEIAYQVLDMMRGVVDYGTGAAIRRMGFHLPAAGKTGTTNEFRDAWFTGFTPTLSTSVWVGFDRAIGLRDRRGTGITGGRGAAPIWADFMIKATEGEPPRGFAVPENIRFVSVNSTTGLPVETGQGVPVALRKGQEVTGQVLAPVEADGTDTGEMLQ